MGGFCSKEERVVSGRRPYDADAIVPATQPGAEDAVVLGTSNEQPAPSTTVDAEAPSATAPQTTPESRPRSPMSLSAKSRSTPSSTGSTPLVSPREQAVTGMVTAASLPQMPEMVAPMLPHAPAQTDEISSDNSRETTLRPVPQRRTSASVAASTVADDENPMTSRAPTSDNYRGGMRTMSPARDARSFNGSNSSDSMAPPDPRAATLNVPDARSMIFVAANNRAAPSPTMKEQRTDAFRDAAPSAGAVAAVADGEDIRGMMNLGTNSQETSTSDVIDLDRHNLEFLNRKKKRGGEADDADVMGSSLSSASSYRSTPDNVSPSASFSDGMPAAPAAASSGAPAPGISVPRLHLSGLIPDFVAGKALSRRTDNNSPPSVGSFIAGSSMSSRSSRSASVVSAPVSPTTSQESSGEIPRIAPHLRMAASASVMDGNISSQSNYVDDDSADGRQSNPPQLTPRRAAGVFANELRQSFGDARSLRNDSVKD